MYMFLKTNKTPPLLLTSLKVDDKNNHPTWRQQQHQPIILVNARYTFEATCLQTCTRASLGIDRDLTALTDSNLPRTRIQTSPSTLVTHLPACLPACLPSFRKHFFSLLTALRIGVHWLVSVYRFGRP